MEPVEKRRSDLLKEKTEEMRDKIREKQSVIVAFSGGIDSSVVSALAYQALGDSALAVTIDSPLLPNRELVEARRAAEEIGINHSVIELEELEIPEFKKNPTDRCYLCKRFRYTKLRELADRKGFRIIADGTNTSDLGQYRPGLRAVQEMEVYSPLLEAELSKQETRVIAKQLNLPTAGKPAGACLASRVPYGQELTKDRLKRVSEAEDIIRGLTEARVIRVRDHGNLARIEIGRDERAMLYHQTLMTRLAKELKKLGYRFVTLDLEGYRFGSYDPKTSKTR